MAELTSYTLSLTEAKKLWAEEFVNDRMKEVNDYILNETFAGWEAIYALKINASRALTVWQAVLLLAPEFETVKPKNGWQKIPQGRIVREALLKAL